VFARLLDRLPPALAEKYVLPWAGGTPRIDRLCTAVTSATVRSAANSALVRAGAGSLPALCGEAMRQAWRDETGPGGTIFEDAARRAVTGLTGENAADSLAMLASARPVDTALAARVLAILAGQDGSAAGYNGQAAQRWLPFLATTVRTCGGHVPARPAVPGIAVGRLVRCAPDGRPADGGASGGRAADGGASGGRAADGHGSGGRAPDGHGSGGRASGGRALARHEGAILLVERPLPPHAPLLLAARGVIARTGTPTPLPPGAGPRVPTVTGCRPEIVTGRHATDGSWLAAIDGTTGEVSLLAR